MKTVRASLITLLATCLMAGFAYPGSRDLARSARKSGPLPHEDEVASGFREALSAAKAEMNRADQIKKALEAVTPALNRQNAALSTPRSRFEKPLAPVLSPASLERDSRRKGAPGTGGAPASSYEPAARAPENAAIEVPPDFPSLIVFEKGKAPEVKLHDPEKEAAPAQLEFTGRKPGR